MGWLNINKDIKYRVDGSYMWLLEGHDHPIEQRDLEPDYCDMPKKEGMRKSALNNTGLWSFRRHHYPRVKHKTIWKFSRMVIDNYLGKSFNDAFSYYLKHTKHIPDRYREFLDYNFCGRRPSYFVDDDGLIQECDYPLSKWQQEWNYNHRPSKLYTFKSYDYATELIHKQSGVPFEVMKQRDSKYWYYPFGLLKNDRLNPSKYEEVVVSGYCVENVQPNSTQEKRLKAEKRQKEKRNRKLWKLERKNKQYSFLTREEEEIKKGKLQDGNVLLKHGFNEESFKGAPYHGRKNKKK